jgi:uncharacterized protein YgiM (DUF1202 family)
MDRRGQLSAAVVAVVVGVALAAPGVARAESFVRVLTQRASVRTGPGPDYRAIYSAERGEVLEVVERGTKGYWFRVELEDGSTGWIFGEQVSPFEVSDESPGFFTRTWRGFRHAVLAPTPIPYSDVGLTFSAGAFGSSGSFDGVFLFRPSWLVDPYFAIEAWGGESPRAQETVYLGGAGLTLRLVPGGSLAPFLFAGAGVARTSPKEDAFTLEPRTLMTSCIGGGFELTTKLRLTLRFDFRNWTIFDENEATNVQEYSGGMAIYF